ncbi:hypothetical protein HDZ31DRAFT_60643 [Schizophyllum fasciatum]
MSQPTVYLVSGANRGIGLALATHLVARPNTIVFAGARKPEEAPELAALAAANPGRVHVVRLVSADKESNLAAVDTIRKTTGRLDVVLANAGVAVMKGALDLELEEMRSHFEVNVNGPVLLFQAAYPLLKESKLPGKFVALTSPIGSIHTGSQWPGGLYNYGASKAALNWTMRKLHRDFENLVIFPISPGLVESGMSAATLEKEPWMLDHTELLKPEVSVEGIIKQVEEGTRETHGGKFVDYTGVGLWEW